MGYKRDAFSGIAWIGGARGINRGLALLKNILAARLLAPQDFGQFGALLLVTSLFEIATTFGVRPIIIQEKKTSHKFLSTAWTISIIRGGLIALAVLISSSFMASFFNDRSLVPLFAVIALVPFIKGFINPGIILLQKELDFSKMAILRGLITLIEFVTTVGAALIIRNVWALLLGFLMAALSETILSFIFSRYRPSLKFDLVKFRSIFNRGKWLTGSSIFNYSATQGDDLLVGRLLGLQNLGFYQLAYKLANLPLTEISDLLSQIVLPIYSKISGDTQRLRRAFLKTTFYSTGLASLLAIFLIIFAQPLVRVVLGERWLPIVPPLRILAIFGVLRSLAENAKPFFFSKGDFKTIAFFDAARTIILAILILPLINYYQISGAALAILISLGVAFPYLLIKIRKN